MQISFKFFFILSLTVLTFSNVQIANSDPSQPNLFSAVDQNVSDMFRETLKDPAVVRERLVHINFDKLSINGKIPRTKTDVSKTLILNLFSDTVYTAKMDHWKMNNSGSFTWTGYLQGIELSQVILVVKDEVVTGNITLPDASYQIRYKGPGLHSIYKIDKSAYPPEEEPIEVDAHPLEDLSLDETMSDDGTSIDVLVVYTDDARAGVGGTTVMETLIDLAVSETNTGYSNSDVTQRLNLVHTAEVSYDETGFVWSTTLYRLRNQSDGYMDEVHALRNCYKADEVVLIVNNTGSCGIAFVMTAVSSGFEDSAFSVVSKNCATGNYSFAHELGHNMGARHDWYVDDTTGSPYSYNHGYVAPAKNWRTIMAYGDDCSGCTRLNYWSNPDNNYGGVPMGVAEGTSTACVEDDPSPDCDADNHKTLNNTAATVANFRQNNAVPPPIVATLSVSSIISTSVSSGGDVTSDCGTSVTARGVCWSTSANPTTSNDKTIDGSGTGSFTSSITGLTPDTEYHVRAYAINSGGTSYGDDLPFTTSAVTYIYVSQDETCDGNSPCYTLIQDAIIAAASGDIVRIAQGTFTEIITLNTTKELTLTGGWDSSFSTQTSNTTIIKAPTASSGSLTLQMITIRP